MCQRAEHERAGARSSSVRESQSSARVRLELVTSSKSPARDVFEVACVRLVSSINQFKRCRDDRRLRVRRSGRRLCTLPLWSVVGRRRGEDAEMWTIADFECGGATEQERARRVETMERVYRVEIMERARTGPQPLSLFEVWTVESLQSRDNGES